MEKNILFSIVVIFCLILLILGNALAGEKEESEVLNVTKSSEKVNHFFFRGRRGSVIYVECLEERPDMALRGCAIDETALQINFVKTAEELPGCSFKAGSNIRLFVFSAYTAEMTKAYIEQFEELSTEIPEIERWKCWNCREKGERTRRTAGRVSGGSGSQ
ncbi:MAG: hypothetical protein ACLVB1_04820 [Blautia obeum]